MKPFRFARFANSPQVASLAVALGTNLSVPLHAATMTWDGGPGGTGTSLDAAENWDTNTLPSPAVPDIIRWNGTVEGPLNLVYSTNAFAGSAGNSGLGILLAAEQTNPVSIDSGTNALALRMSGLSLASGAGAFTLGNGANVFNITLGGTSGQTHTWTNNSSSGVNVSSDVVFGLGGGGSHTLALTGSGNFNFSNAMGSVALATTKSGSGTAVMSSTGTGAINVAGGVLRLGGTTGTNTASGGFRVGTVSSTAAVLEIVAGATITNRANLFVGDAGSGTGGGAVYHSGGALTLTQGAGIDNLRIGSNSGGYGYYRISGGTLTSNEIGIGASLSDTTGVMDVAGGTVTSNGWIALGRGGVTSSGLLNLTGGTVNASRIELNWGTNAAALSVLNVAGGAVNATGSGTGLNLASVSSTAGVQGVANLLSGGTLTASIVQASQANQVTALNFNGGTLKAHTTNSGATFLNSANIDRVNVFAGGGTIDNSNSGITVGNALAAPSGHGVEASSISVSTGGSGYTGAPMVKLSGGSGTGATGYAVLTGGVVTSIVMTSPGTGYTAGETLTATFVGGGASAAASSITGITVATNTSGGMTFSGNGTTTLTAANSYSGNTLISSGTLALGGTAGSLATGSAITAHGTFAINRTNAAVQGTDFTGSSIGGSGGLAATGTGLHLTLNTANAYLGTTTIGAGQNNSVLRAAASNALGSGAILFDTGGNASTARLEVAGGISLTNPVNLAARTNSSEAILNISGNNTLSGNINLGIGGGNYTFGSTEGALTLTGNITPPSSGDRGVFFTGAGHIEMSGDIVFTTGNTLAVTKQGSGTLTLSGSNTYTGATTVSAGALFVNGALGNSSVSVTGGTLGGSGAIAGTVSVSGTLSPGNSIETLSTGSLTMAAGSSYLFEAADNSATGADLVVVNGTLSLSDVTLDFDAATLAAFASESWGIGDKITLISYTGTGITSGFTAYADDASYAFGSNQWLFNYNDSIAGNNFNPEATGTSFVTMTVIPEPGAALLGGLGMLALLRRRRP